MSKKFTPIELHSDKLNKNESWLRNALDNLIEGFQLISFDWTYLYMNKAAIKYSHEEPENIIGQKIQDVYPGIEHSDMFRHMEHCMTHRVSSSFENRFIYPDGEEAWFDLRVAPVPEGISVLALEITDKKKNEEVLIESESRHRDLFETSAQGILYLNEKGDIITANASAKKILGYSLAKLRELNIVDLQWYNVHKDDAPLLSHEHPVNIAIQTNTDSKIVIGVFNPRLKQIFWLSLHVHLQTENDNTLKQILVTFEDITQLREAISELRKSNRRISGINEINQAILKANIGDNTVNEIAMKQIQKLVSCNEIHIDIFEKTNQNTENPDSRILSQLFDFNDSEDRKPELLRLDKNTADSPAKLLFLEQGFIEIMAAPLHYNGEMKGVLTLMRRQEPFFSPEDKLVAEEIASSISLNLAQMEAKQILHEHSETLEQRIKERTAELYEISGFQQAILENSRMAIFSVDKDGIIQTYNHSAEELTGHSTSDVIGKHVSELYNDMRAVYEDMIQNGYCDPKTDFNSFLRSDIFKINRGSVPTMETVFVRKDRSKVPVLINSASLRDDMGNVIGHVGFALDITKRKEVENALKQSEERFSRMFYDHSAIMLLIEPDSGRIINANKSAANFYGHDFEQNELYIYDINLLSKEEVDACRIRALNNIQNHFIYQHILASGDIRTVEVYSAPISVKEQILLFSIIHDVTERQKAELLLQKSEEENRAILNSVPDMLFRISKDGTFLDCKVSKESLLFLPKEQFLHKKLVDTLPSEISTEAMTCIKEALEQQKVVTFEYSLEVTEGKAYFENRITPISDQEALSIVRNVTEQKQTEEALRLSDQRWQFALEGSGDGVWDWNVQTGSIYYSHQWKHMLGYEDDDISGQISEWSSRLHPEDIDPTYAALDKHFEEKNEVYHSEFRMRCSDGSYKWILGRGKVVEWTEEGKPMRMIGTHTDISSMKEAEEQLRQTIEREKELSMMKSGFVATASHEFRTPLASIILVCETLSNYWEKLSTDQIRLKLNTMKEQSDHLCSIVNDVLQLSKIQDGKIAFRPEHIDLIKLTKVIVDEFNSEKDAPQRVFLQTNTSSIILNADKRLMRQVLNNLISNAIKYSPRNPQVDLNISYQQTGCEIRVQDNGIGIPTEEQNKLFTPFYRASNARYIKGNGLGLNIVQEAIKAHAGNLSFRSTPEVGSTFLVNLPNTIILEAKMTDPTETLYTSGNKSELN